MASGCRPQGHTNLESNRIQKTVGEASNIHNGALKCNPIKLKDVGGKGTRRSKVTQYFSFTKASITYVMYMR